MILMYMTLTALTGFLIGFFSLKLWSEYNHKKYGKLNRRQSGIGLVDKNNAYPQDVMQLRDSFHILVSVDQNGKIKELKALDQ